MSIYTSAVPFIEAGCRRQMSRHMMTMVDAVQVELPRKDNTQLRIHASSVEDWWFTRIEGRGTAVVGADRRTLKVTDHDLLMLPLSGHSHAVNGRWLFPSVGQMVLSPWSEADAVLSGGDFQYLIACIPRSQLDALSSSGVPYGRPIETAHGAGAVLNALLRTLVNEATCGGDVSALAPMLPDFARLALSAMHRRRSTLVLTRPPRALSRFERILDYLNLHLSDQTLSREQVVRSVGISRRQLSREFERRKDTFTGCLRRMRLKRARLLLNTAPDMPLTQICYDCGFTSPTVFGRAFRREFGQSPKSFRARQRT